MLAQEAGEHVERDGHGFQAEVGNDELVADARTIMPVVASAMNPYNSTWWAFFFLEVLQGQDHGQNAGEDEQPVEKEREFVALI